MPSPWPAACANWERCLQPTSTSSPRWVNALGIPTGTVQLDLGLLTKGSTGLVAPELLLLKFSFQCGGGNSWIPPFHKVRAPAAGVMFPACFRGILSLQLWHNRFMSCFCFSGIEKFRFALRRGFSQSSRCSFCCVFYLKQVFHDSLQRGSPRNAALAGLCLGRMRCPG